MTSVPDFSKAKETYKENAFAQKQMANTLSALCLKHFGANWGKILEIGSGTRLLTKNIADNFKFNEIILNDLTDNFTGFNFPFLRGDAAKITLPGECDLIISNACFQWILDVKNFFIKLKNILKSDGVLAFSSFAQDNCREFKLITGLGLEYVNYPKILKECGYEIVEYQRELKTIYFKTPRDVLRHIKSTGAIVSEGYIRSKSILRAFEEEYNRRFSDDMGVSLTYNPLYILARPK